MTRTLTAALSGRPSGSQDLWHARLFLLRPLVRMALALLWVVSGLVGLISNPAAYESVAAALGDATTPVVIAFSRVDLAIAAALVRGWRLKLVADVQMALVLAYTLGLGLLAPALWSDPLGGLLKNIPILVLISGAPRAGRRAMSDGYLWIKVLHVLSATLLFGTGLGTAFHMYMTHLRGNVTEIAAAPRNTILADWLFTLPSGVVQPLTGLAMVWIAGFDVFESWLTASYVLYIVAAACWIRVVVLQYRVHALAQDALRSSRPLQPEYFEAMRQWFVLGWPAFLSLLVVFMLMVMKPPLW